MYAIFLWKSAWRAGSEHVWRASANPKKKIITQMSTISGSVRTVRYSCQRRWNSDEYESKYCRGGVEQSGDGCVRYIWVSGAEFAEFADLNRIGAVTTKGVANIPWAGNPTPRVAETYGGMMNAVGLQNPGIDLFCERDIPFLRKYDTKIIVNVCGKSTEDYCEVVERLADEDVDMLEINISCPNVKEGGIAFGQDPKPPRRSQKR